MLVTGSANAINQVAEKDTDAKMKRTAKRPVASGRMSVNEATMFAVITGAVGVFILWYWFNYQAALTGLFSLFLYGFIYTPLKKVNSIAVLVGAIPGAIPCLIGWVAATGEFQCRRMDIIWHPVFLAVPTFLGNCLDSSYRLHRSRV